MHELSIAQTIMDRVETIRIENAADGIASVQIQVGNLSGVDPHALGLAFTVAVENTPYADTRWDIKHVAASVKCRSCGAVSTPEGPFPLCVDCDSTDIEIVMGRQLMIESVEVASPSDV